MRPTFLTACLLCAAAIGGVVRADDDAPRRHLKKRVGVAGFVDATGTTWLGRKGALADTGADAVTDALVRSGAFVVVDREQLRHLLGDGALAASGVVSPPGAAKASRALGLQAIVSGRITDFGMRDKNDGFGDAAERAMRARVSLRVVDATSGDVWLAESGEGVARESEIAAGAQNQDELLGQRALYNAVRGMIGKMMRKAATRPWEGAIAKVGADKKVYVTAGSDIGLPLGSSLVVRRQGAAISDPATGTVIGHELGPTLATLRVESHLSDRLSMCVTLKGGSFAAGDKVALDPRGGAEEQAHAELPPRPVARPVEVSRPAARPVAVKPATPPAKPAPKTPGKCPDERFTSPATGGHRCWREQVWSDQMRACVGIPRCPKGCLAKGTDCVPAPSSPIQEE